MGDKKCTFGVRAPIDVHMLNEKIMREMKHFQNYKTYRADFAAIPVAGKFYAHHDQTKHESKEQAEKVQFYFTGVKMSRALGPHAKYPQPPTDNTVYGWYHKPLFAIDRNDKRFYHPKVESEHTKIEVMIRKDNPKRQAAAN